MRTMITLLHTRMLPPEFRRCCLLSSNAGDLAQFPSGARVVIKCSQTNRRARKESKRLKKDCTLKTITILRMQLELFKRGRRSRQLKLVELLAQTIVWTISACFVIVL